MQLKSLDAALLNQAVITGQVSDVVTGNPLRMPISVTLQWRAIGTTDYKTVNKQPRITAGGHFAYFGPPESFFPVLAGGVGLDCILKVSAEGYQESQFNFSLSAADIVPTETTETLGDYEVSRLKLDAPVHQQPVTLFPNPVSMAGRVIIDNDPDSPVVGATVTVGTPPNSKSDTTDARGYYRVDDLPVLAQVTVSVEAAEGSLSEDIFLDYGKRINERTFSLSA